MNNNIKISLNIKLPGGTLVRQEKKEVITFTNKKGKKIKKTVSSYDLVPKPAYLQKNITQEAYDYYASMESCPVAHMRKEWKKMNIEARVAFHMAGLCSYYKGEGFSFHVFED
jgi:hypothetical protein